MERAVRKSESITAEEAATHKVIDFIAVDVSDLLAKADGGTLWSASRRGS